MSNLTSVMMAPANAGARVSGNGAPGSNVSAADQNAGEPVTSDFGALLDAGIERQADTPDSGQTAQNGESATKEDGSAETVDPAALLNSLQSPQHLSASAPAGEMHAAAEGDSATGTQAAAALNIRGMLVGVPDDRPGSSRADGPDQANNIRSRRATAAFPGTATATMALTVETSADHRLAEPHIKGADLQQNMPAGAMPGHETGRAPSPLPDTAPNARIETLPQRVGTPAWQEGFASRVVWLVKGDRQTAEIRLNPAELGPIEVKLTLSGEGNGEATVQFSAAHAATREAIEAAMPRLREMMQDTGIALGKSSVDAGLAGGSERDQQAGGQTTKNPEAAETAHPGAPAGTAEQRHRGLVDTFA